MMFTPEQSSLLLNIARDAIRAKLRHEPLEAVPTGNIALQQPAGCFVTLHESATHTLRGCIGRTEASGPLADTVQQMAVAVLDDPRFSQNRIRLEDLQKLEIDLSILSPLLSTTGPFDFDLLNDGIVLTIAGRSGLFLPQVARDTGWSKKQLLARLCTEKMGLAANAWQAGARLQKFSTVIIGPEPFELPATF